MWLCTIPLLFATIPEDVRQAIWVAELRRKEAPTFKSWMEAPDPEIRARATLALGRVQRPAAALPLLKIAAADPDVTVRRAAAFALGINAGSSAILLERLAAERDPEVLDVVIHGLGRQGESAAVAPLLAELTGPNAAAAAEALGRLGQRKVEEASSARVIERLLDLIGSPDGLQLPSLGQTRNASAWALSRLGATRIAEVDRQRMADLVLLDRSPRVRAWVLRAWAPAASEAERGRILALAAEDHAAGVRIAVARALARLATPGVERILAKLLDDREEPVILEAIAAAGTAPGVEMGEMLSPRLKSPNPRIAAAAVVAMAARGALDPRPYLEVNVPVPVRAAAAATLRDRSELLKLALGDLEPAVRTAATGTLLEADPGPNTLTSLLRAKDLAIVEATADALAKKPEPSLEPALVEVLGRPDLSSTTALATVRALSALYFSGRVPRPSPNAAARIGPWLGSPAMGTDGARLAGLLNLKPPTPTPLADPPPLALVERVRSARVVTEEGEFRIELFPDVAPYTVWNFVSLAETGYFDGLVFHRVVADFVAQTGDPRGDGWGGPGYVIPDELSDLSYREGAVGMALAGPDTGGSQWFVTVSPQPHLDGGYTVFGQVTVGMQYVRALDQGDHVERVIIEWEGSPPSAPRAPRPSG